MWFNYFKIALRSLIKDKSTSIINIGGLAMGMTVTILLGLWIYDELTFNKTHTNYKQIGIVMVSGDQGWQDWDHPDHRCPAWY